MKKILVFLRPIKYLIKLFFYSPKYYSKKILADFKKDLNSKKLKKNFHIVWCAGLPKSGTTLIEDILSELNLVKANNSFFRIYDDINLDHPHAISEDMFFKFPKSKLTFLKTHTHYNKEYIEIAKKYNSKIIISMRDLRDVMISRYHHIMLDKKHWQHKMIKDLNFNNGFIESLNQTDKSQKFIKPIDYFYNWIKNWKTHAKNNKNYLVLWYEEFIQNSENYISKIVDYLDFEDLNVNKIKFKLDQEKEVYKKNSLVENLNLLDKKTFREGKLFGWKKTLDKTTLEKFNASLPGNIEEIEYKN